MMTNTVMIAPVVALVAWSMVMWLWMYATRIPAVIRMRIKLDPYALNGSQMATLPPEVRWKADNYNHLMEQPTVFYAIALSLALLGGGDEINRYLAWTYVGVRVVHSLVQALGMKIELRFVLFVLSNIPLLLLTFNAIDIIAVR